MLGNFFDVLAGALLPRHIPQHRGTPARLMLQEAQRAEREAEHAQALVRADLIANGSRIDWVMVEN
jgi:hypothetical protein